MAIDNKNTVLNAPSKGNVPALRFPEFTEEWEKCALAEICNIVGRIGFRGYTIQDIVEKGTGAIALSPSNITDNRLSYDKDNTYINYFKYEESPEIKVFVGDIVFVKTGSTVGKVAYVDNILCETTLNPQLVVLKNIKCNSFLLGQILSAYKFQNAIKRITVGGAVPTLSQNEMGKISVSIPQKMEQKKIATLFQLIDDRISIQSRIIEDLKKLKSAFVEMLFCKQGGVLFKLGDAGSFIRGSTYSSDDITEDINATTVIRANNLNYGNNVSKKDVVYVNKKPTEIQILCKGDIVICMANGSSSLVGKNSYYSFDDRQSTIGAFTKYWVMDISR